jgi:hypothetical protein
MSQSGFSPAVVTAIAGALFVGAAAAVLAAFVIGPSAGLSFGLAESLMFGVVASVFGVIAGAVAGAEGDHEEVESLPASARKSAVARELTAH